MWGLGLEIGDTAIEQITAPDGKSAQRTTRRIGRVTIHTYTDSDGNTFVETKLDSPISPLRPARPPRE